MPARPVPLVKLGQSIPTEDLESLKATLEADSAVRDRVTPLAKDGLLAIDHAIHCYHCGQYEVSIAIVMNNLPFLRSLDLFEL